MKLVKYTPQVVSTLMLAAVTSAWLASRGIAREEGFAGATSVAVWFLGFALLALAYSAVAAGVCLVRRKRFSASERLSGMLPFPLLIVALTLAFLFLKRSSH